MEKNKINDSLAKVLDITPIPAKPQAVVIPSKAPKEIEVIEENPDAVDDYNLSRTTYRDLIAKGVLALEDIKDLAKDLESPRAYEVLATMMKTISDVTRDLYDLQKKAKEMRTPSQKGRLDDTAITVEKAVFVGTTAQLLQQLKDNDKVIDG